MEGQWKQWKQWLAPILVLVVALTLSYTAQRVHTSTFEDPKLLEHGMKTPTIWLYYDDSEVNSRWWSDFGARSSRVLNLPFLNLCYASIVKAAGSNYHVEVISGIADAAQKLGGWDKLPYNMRNKKIPIGPEELTYLRVAFLEQFGGLWINPATICIAPLPEFSKESVVFFGSDPTETYSGSQLPNQNVVWSPVPHHPVFQDWRKNLNERLTKMAGGTNIRNDKNWDLVFVSSGRKDVVRYSDLELTRKKNGRKIELEDLLATGGDLTFPIPSDTLFVPFPWPEVLQRRMFGWFLRMSEQQIMESDIAVKYVFERAGVQ